VRVRRDDPGGGAGAVPGAPRHLSASGADAGAPPFDGAHSRVAAAMARVLALRALEQPDRPHRPELAALLVVIWCVCRDRSGRTALAARRRRGSVCGRRDASATEADPARPI